MSVFCGRAKAILLPIIEPIIPKIPIIIPLFINSLSLNFGITAATELGIAVINETPCAAKFPIPPKKISKGILIIPPPIPSNPEPNPERMPMRIYNKIFSSNLELKFVQNTFCKLQTTKVQRTFFVNF